MRFLVIGGGSIGKRHARNLISLSQKVTICDPAEQRRKEALALGAAFQPDYREALKQGFDAALVCTPTSAHVAPAIAALKAGCHTFMEKPISHTLEGTSEIVRLARHKKLITLVGCNLRFYPSLAKAKQLLDSGAIGKPLSARVEFGYYLPYWHPKEDYRTGYSANKKLGGGVILDAIHELDYVRWFLGEAKAVSCFAGKLSNLKMDTEDTAEILLKFQSGAVAEVHLDYLQRKYSRNCQIVGEKGTLSWDFTEKTVAVADEKGRKATVIGAGDGPNGMYLREMEHFINCIKGREKPQLDAAGGRRVLEIALAAKKASAQGRVLRI
jgi:predicted dehydrogenase